MYRLLASLAMALALLTGCIEVPELDAAISDDAENTDAPNLLPIETAVATSVEPRLDGSEAEVLTRRAEALKSEAAMSNSPTNAEILDAKARRLNQRAEDLRNR